MLSDKVIGVTAVAFSKNIQLVNKLKSYGFKNIKTNTNGKRFTKTELIKFLSDTDGAIIGLDKIDDSVLSQTTKLKVISKYGVGLDNINAEDCRNNKVSIVHTQGVNKRSVSEQVLGSMLMLARNTYITSNQLKNGIWNKSGGFQLSNKTVGIIGVGHIGKDLIKLLKPFNCKILVNDIKNQSEYYKVNNLKDVSKEELFKCCDIITIHTPLTPELKYIINKDSLALMKPTAILINSARGGLVNQEDLKFALQNKIILGAAIDPYENEPPTDQDFINIPQLIATPHVGGNSVEAVRAMGFAAIENIVKFYS